jgi:N-acetylglucosaminyldiphosphoundecaprenol N-acetyl-beta-D-mannosaminyltransferase
MKMREENMLSILGIGVDAVNMDSAISHLSEALSTSKKGYVCVTGVHGVMEARRNPALLEIFSGSELTVPDGMPLVWAGHIQGFGDMGRVFGPGLMLEVLRRPEFRDATHFFYGGQEGVAEELREKLVQRFPWLKVIGTYTPPFRDLSTTEFEDLQATVARLRPDCFWVGISTPKQEIFMAKYLPLLDTKLMFGVGAAFDYHTGRIKDCAEWIKKAGLQWLHRLLQDPKRLWKRYLRNNPVFLFHIALQLTGLRRYPCLTKRHHTESQLHTEAHS